MVIAPIYIIITINPKNSKPKEIKKPELYKKTRTNQNTEWIGLEDVIAIITVPNSKMENKKNNCSM